MTEPKPTTDQRTILLPEGEYAAYLANRAAAAADEQVRRRETRWHALLTGLFAVAAFLGYWNLQAQRSDLDKAIENVEKRLDKAIENIEKRLAKDIESAARNELPKLTRDYFREGGREIMAEPIAAVRDEFEAQTAFVQFVALARRLDEATSSVSFADRDLAIRLLERAIKLPKIRESEEFLLSLERLIRALVDSRNIEALEDIDSKIREHLGRRQQIVAHMLRHYGHLVFGEAQVTPQMTERYEHYLAQAKRHGIRVRTAVFTPAYSFQQAGLRRNPTTEEQLKDLSSLPQSQLREALQLVDTYVIGHGEKGAFRQPYPYALRIQKVYAGLTTAYKKEFDELRRSVQAR